MDKAPYGNEKQNKITRKAAEQEGDGSHEYLWDHYLFGTHWDRLANFYGTDMTIFTMEQDFGITNYLGDRKVSVPCVLKELYSDFIVQEVLDDQSVLQLRTADEIKGYVKEEEERGVDETVAVPSFMNTEQLASLDGMNKDSKPLLISCEGFSKDDRRALHEFVRLRYRGTLNTETKENAIEVNFCGIGSRARSIPPELQSVLESRLEEFDRSGFINYFGYLGTVGDALRCWKKTKDASQALRYLKGSQAYASIEAIIFKCLAKGGTWQKNGITTRAIGEDEMVGDFMALQVQFSLPSGCYATVALRQITGTDMGKNSMKVLQ
ncbi:hypothetical protein TELCIR_05982 [Teladorsagia circumcincta]|uniref:tRNA pseudouridine synthase D n=1 Tax=Teladorsagia circumcincta TaxID=45464 RepID=A0A2G9UP77_TELCI|nr:hypothetical protein TELCIR_05982 [Teladorsagia circumcincta]